MAFKVEYCSDWIDGKRLPGSGLLELIAILSVKFHHPEITAYLYTVQVFCVRFCHDFKRNYLN